MARVNTGKQMTASWTWKYGATSKLVKLVKVLNGSGSTFYSDTEVALLTESEYTTAFNNTVSYMKNVLKISENKLPSLADSYKTNTTACPVIETVTITSSVCQTADENLA